MNLRADPDVSRIRAASRKLVRELGFMQKTLAGTEYSASAVHAIIELGECGGMSAKQLCERLLLEKSTVSRLLKMLVERGIIEETRCEADARSKDLKLTAEGERLFAGITNWAQTRVARALETLETAQRQCVVEGLELYSQALDDGRAETDAANRQGTVIKAGYRPGIVGWIAQMHGSYYARERGFGVMFEAIVARGVAEFAPRLESPANEIWYVEEGGELRGTIAIDGEDLGENRGHLRWFFLDPRLRGRGLGKDLMRRAMEHCDAQGFAETHLWTLKGLDTARALYEAFGFTLAEEYRGDQWGKEAIEQKFVRPRPK
ncbi:MarR family transcriptional regulator [Rhizobiales bacterium]|uniref:bifunctional helix-turn-helix transcriptional regulator/GNAT family N-acetyltransferase n=1 Tax=Hongsoonwoonella zoysiae TaxID=2821844 RepID=UPI00155FB4CB|nr:helix-turn-helix domain-containing GNAT family N-acetyltransferase [Hongsoonwoonella zoysiae]NRG19690.1 MarR family transcriptional regulator [Hongsoonwoonella zoysiae]